jgi:uncharacterized membrane protein (DUF373 family)
VKRALRRIVMVLESVLTGALMVMVIFAIAGLGVELVHPSRFFNSEGVADVIDHIIEVFVLIELLATALAYLERRDIVRRILEAALVAISRKLIAISLGTAPLASAGALAILLLALTAAWWVLVDLAGRRDKASQSPVRLRARTVRLRALPTSFRIRRPGPGSGR